MTADLQNVSASCLFASPFDEDSLTDAVRGCLDRLGTDPDLVLAFASSDYRRHIGKLVEILQIDGHARTIAGTSAGGMFGVGMQYENATGVSLLFLRLPGARIKVDTNEGKTLSTKFTIGGSGYIPSATLLFGNPVSADLADTRDAFSKAFPDTPVVGGLISGGPDAEDLFLFTERGIRPADRMAIQFFGGIRLESLVSQACRPIGDPFVITRASANEIVEIGQRKAMDVLEEAFQSLEEMDRELAEGNVYAGLAARENVEDFQIGDFLISHIVGADLDTGSLVLDAPARVGQTMQFQLRDPALAANDLARRCAEKRSQQGAPLAVIVCNGRERSMAFYEDTAEDVNSLRRHFGDVPVAGLFTNGEIAPVDGKNFSHSLSLSAALLYPNLDSPAARPAPSSTGTA